MKYLMGIVGYYEKIHPKSPKKIQTKNLAIIYIALRKFQHMKLQKKGVKIKCK
jgi:hypothetical protein